MVISIANNLINEFTPYSYTTDETISGDASIPIRNINAFTTNYAVQIGKTGEEQSEIVIISAPSGTALTLASGTLLYPHNLDSLVYNIHYNAVIVKRSTTGTAGTATAIATVSITPDSLYTNYDDTSGASTYAYKTQYTNTTSGDTSSESDWFTPSGPSWYSVQKLRQRSKDALYNANYLKSDDVVLDWLNEWVEEMNNAAIKVNKGYAIGTAQYAFGTAGYGTITEGGFKQAARVEITYDGNSYITSTELPISQYDENDTYISSFPRHSWEGDSIFRVHPYGAVGTARFSFGKLHTVLENETDELPMPLRSYTTGAIEYVLYRAYENDNKETQAERHYTKFLQKKNDFINEMTPRDQTGVKYIDFTEELSPYTFDEI